MRLQDTLELIRRGVDNSKDRLSIEWSEDHIENVSRTAQDTPPGQSPFEKEMASVLLLCAYGKFIEAETILLNTLVKCLSQAYINNEEFNACINALCTVQRLDIATTMMCDRLGFGHKIQIKYDDTGLNTECLRWTIDREFCHTLTLDRHVLRRDDTRIIILFLEWIFPICAFYSVQPDQEYGEVTINLGDAGIQPGFAFCDNRPDRFLIPDNVFIPTRGYSLVKEIFLNNPVAWQDRQPKAFWRGSTTGTMRSPGDWRSLDRVQLCEIALKPENALIIDAGISSLAQLPESAFREIQAAGLLRGPVPWEEWPGYKYQIDIDGNTNAWSGMFTRLLTGSPVLKVQSKRGMSQWYYDRLIPWVNYVPVASDMADLADKVQWLIKHDTTAEEIGQRGYELARSMTYGGELRAIVPVISKAFRYFRQVPSNIHVSEEVLGRQALTAHSKGDWETAEQLWRDYVTKFPQMANGHAQWGRSLRELGRYDEAETVLTAALERFPNEVEVGEQYAWMAHSLVNWEEALHRWSALMKRFPMHTGVISGHGIALWNLQLQTGTTVAPTVPDLEGSSTLVHFESLGDNCEFGFVQRRFGLEPLGLLRWSYIQPSMLMEALDIRFSGVGERENAIIRVTSETDDEYMISDRRFDMGMHTYTRRADVKDLDRFFDQQLKRIQFLRRKLLEDLEIGEKIFVYKGTPSMSWSEIMRLYESFHRQTNATLLCVVENKESQSAVLKASDRLFIGCLQHIVQPAADPNRIDYVTWLKICAQTVDMVSG